MKNLTIKEFKSKLGEILDLDSNSLKLVARSGGGIRVWHLVLDFKHSEIQKIVISRSIVKNSK